MCIAIYAEPGQQLTEEELRRGWSANPDGGGFAYFRPDGSIATYRSMQLEPFLRAYDMASSKYRNSEFAVHMRIATSGVVAKRNVHPFRQDRFTVWIHNGVLPTAPEGKRSDTAVFVEDYLPELGECWMDSPKLFDLVSEYCSGSKLVGLTGNPKAKSRAYIVNESSGFWSSGVWYSNRSCEPVARRDWQSALFPTEAEEADSSLCILCGGLWLYPGSVTFGETLLCSDCETCQSCAEDYLDCKCGTGSIKLYRLTEGQYLELS